ncbi:hypothetical protein [Microbacterium sp. p3-SID336]|uniref:hypothetical protein n=1 Tax=Microbacterium sp. p3-SID336 TaxID=2916212 RepID=UPI0021A38B12|nr:hypothetical protein [Microbacterium sp. p3-SID336]MCT1478057.1 hypothetical protein [Microbacterium sp. p3-SID336]
MIPVSSFRAPTAIAAILATLVSLAACSPAPDATPSPTATPLFATEKEAFAAAEATYRAYRDAANASVLNDSSTFEAVFTWLRSDALAASRKSLTAYNAEGATRIGESTFDHFTPVAYDGTAITARLCLDVSQVDVVDPAGVSIVASDRPARQPLEVELRRAQTATGLAIFSSIATEELSC